MKPLLGIQEAFVEVRKEESRKKVMMGTSSNTNKSSIPTACGFNPPGNDNNMPRRGRRPWCDHCNQPDHTKEICWKLHNKPPNWKPNGTLKNRGFTTIGDSTPTPETSLFSKEQMESLKKLFSSSSSTSRPKYDSTIEYWFSGTSGQSINGFGLSN